LNTAYHQGDKTAYFESVDFDVMDEDGNPVEYDSNDDDDD
jgi:hypothetical protein